MTGDGEPRGVDVAGVRAVARHLRTSEDRRPDAGPAKADRRRVSAARRALRSYAPYAPTGSSGARRAA